MVCSSYEIKKTVENEEIEVHPVFWLEALRNATRIEQKYSKENLIVSDDQFFEMKGKLAALH